MYTTGKELKEIAKAVEKDPEWVMHLTIISLCSYLQTGLQKMCSLTNYYQSMCKTV